MFKSEGQVRKGHKKCHDDFTVYPVFLHILFLRNFGNLGIKVRDLKYQKGVIILNWVFSSVSPLLNNIPKFKIVLFDLIIGGQN